MNRMFRKLGGGAGSPAQSPFPRWAGLLWSLAITLAGAACIGLLSLYFGAGDFKLALFERYFDVPGLVALNLLPVLLLALLLWFLLGRAWASLLATSAVVMALTIISALKVSLRGTPLLWEDLRLVSEAVGISRLYALSITPGQWRAAGLCLLAVGAAALLARRRLRSWPLRLGGAGATLAAMLALFFAVYQNADIYAATENPGLINRWSTTEVYQSRGFLYPFLYSARDARDAPPEGYDPARAAAALAAYEDGALAEGQRVSVMAIMLEAYADLTELPGLGGLAQVQEVYAPWHALAEESWSGRLVTNSFGGGTVETERAFLTGFSRLGSFRGQSNSYVRWFTDQGYAALGGHPNNNWFYDRRSVNANLGFDSYRFLEDHYGFLGTEEERVRDSDGAFFSDLLTWLEETDGPCFQFSVSFQNHGPYASEGAEERVLPEDTGWSAAAESILNNYLAGIRRTNAALTELTDGLRGLEEPVVLVLFGDHKPWLGDEELVLRELEINTDPGTLQGLYNYYATPYLIWGNAAARAALGTELRGQGPDLSPCFLMNELFDQCGWVGPAFMQLSNTLKAAVPVVHGSGSFLEEGRLTDKLTPARQALFDTYSQVQYHWRRSPVN